MKTRNKKDFLLLGVFVGFILPHAGAAQLYSATKLQGLDGNNSIALGINNLGQVVGASWYGGNNLQLHAMLWNGKSATELSDHAVAYDINDIGLIVGKSDTNSNNNGFSTIWQNGTKTKIGDVPGSLYSVNNSGVAVGIDSSVGTPIVYSKGVTSYLPIPYYAGFSYAYGVNSLGTIVGVDYVHQNAVVWTKDGVQSFGSGTAYAINDGGTIVGSTNSSSWSSGEAFIYQNTKLNLLPSSGFGSAALDVNSSGTVVGYYHATQYGITHATVWIGGKLIDLNGSIASGSTISGVLNVARGINDLGQIIVDGTEGSWLLTPVTIPSVPEPSSITMFLVGCVSMIFAATSRKLVGN